ncbi:MAG: hypothetical protein FE044_04095 [Thermoplasmata archaeon]|nr:MAG: hypothetical protein FE044_04095 [Thermoplasmata archaeon]MCD6573441.1 hypothetical protein [Thermoplasmata archaeon]
MTKKAKRKDMLKEKLEELEEAIRYNEAMLEELYEKQESLFPVFADLVKIISKLYNEMEIDDEDVKNRINRLKDAFNENIMKKYAMSEDDFGIAYT